MWWLPALAIADPVPDDGFRFARTTSGCTVDMRPESHPDGPAMRATCRWPEVDPEAFAAAVSEPSTYTAHVFPLDESRVVRFEPGRMLVYQRQSVTGLATREVLLWMTVERAADGAVAVAWRAANEEPLTLQPGAVRTPKNSGYWRVRPDPAGGTLAEHGIEVQGGGQVPKWIVQFARNWAYNRILADSRAYGAALPPR